MGWGEDFLFGKIEPCAQTQVVPNRLALRKRFTGYLKLVFTRDTVADELMEFIQFVAAYRIKTKTRRTKHMQLLVSLYITFICFYAFGSGWRCAVGAPLTTYLNK